MKRKIPSLLYRLKVDKIVDKCLALMDELRLMRIRECTGQQLKYVNQGWNTPKVVCARGNGKFEIGKGSHLKSDSYVEYMG